MMPLTEAAAAMASRTLPATGSKAMRVPLPPVISWTRAARSSSSVGDYEVRTKSKEFGLLPGSTRCGDADGAFRSCNLDGSDADAAARSGDQDEIALGELALLDERAVGSEVLHPDAGSLLEGK